jgi:hypothetical protein
MSSHGVSARGPSVSGVFVLALSGGMPNGENNDLLAGFVE